MNEWVNKLSKFPTTTGRLKGLICDLLINCTLSLLLRSCCLVAKLCLTLLQPHGTRWTSPTFCFHLFDLSNCFLHQSGLCLRANLVTSGSNQMRRLRHLTPVICCDKRRGLSGMLQKEQGLLLLNELRSISGYTIYLLCDVL